MVIAFGKIIEARERGREEGRKEGREEVRKEMARKEGREEGREEMARAMRALGRPESEIQQALGWQDRRKNGESGS